MKKLFQQHYQAIVKRGLINDDTNLDDFLDKLDEEVFELKESIDFWVIEKFKQESIDCICVLTNMLQHLGVDIEVELRKNIKIQEKRANETNK